MEGPAVTGQYSDASWIDRPSVSNVSSESRSESFYEQ